MPRTPKSESLHHFRAYFDQSATLSLLQRAAGDPSIRDQILRDAPLHGEFDKTRQWTALLNTAMSVYHKDLYYHHVFKNLKIEAPRKATHQEKRAMVHKLRLNKQNMRSVTQYIDQHGYPAAETFFKETYGIDLVLRNRKHPLLHSGAFPGEEYHKYKSGKHLAERGKPTAGSYTCTSPEFYVIPPTQSVIILSQKGSEYTLELVVLRNMPSDSEFGSPLTSWLHQVILQAARERRDVRPTHPGKMVQIGLNMGARHARILGWAKSFTVNLTDAQKRSADSDLLGGMSLFWAIVRSNMPPEIVDPIETILDSGYPRMNTRSLEKNTGFTVVYKGKSYVFSDTARAPPEGYATYDYEAPTHTDITLDVKWSFGWTVSRTTTKTTLGNEGGNLVDLGLGVVVQNATGTLTAFQPDSLHGTTATTGVSTCGLSLSFSRRVGEAYQELEKEGGRIAFGYGAV